MAEKTARTRSVTELKPGVLLVDVQCLDPPSLVWRSGQFLSIRTGDPVHHDPDARRSYSIASRPDVTGRFELLVKLLPDGVGSQFFVDLAPGDDLHFTGPMGFFVPELRHAGDAVFAVTGTGIAAALPMIEETVERVEETGRVILYWGMRDDSELYLLDRLAAIRSPRFHLHIALSQPGPAPWAGLRGRINAHVMAARPSFDRAVFYLVGNGNMVRDLKQLLIEAGVDRKRQIRQEIFYPATKP